MGVTVEGVDKAIAKTKAATQMQSYRVAMNDALELVFDAAEKYPAGSAPGTFKALATPGQKRAYFAKIRANPSLADANGRYIRQEKHKNQWTKKVVIQTNAVIAGVVSNLNGHGYAQFLQVVPGRQSFHRVTGWFTVKQIAAQKRRAVARIFGDAVRVIVRG